MKGVFCVFLLLMLYGCQPSMQPVLHSEEQFQLNKADYESTAFLYMPRLSFPSVRTDFQLAKNGNVLYAADSIGVIAHLDGFSLQNLNGSYSSHKTLVVLNKSDTSYQFTTKRMSFDLSEMPPDSLLKEDLLFILRQHAVSKSK